MKNPLIDKEFLKALDEKQVKEVFAKVIALDFEDNPIEEVQGIITQGSINIEGSSAVRRSCSLSIAAKEMDIHEYYWGLKTKFQLFAGITNDINPEYPDIIWFPQGTYVISSFNTSQGIGSYSISIQGNDKMSLLNGEAGGVITALTVDFGTIDNIDERGNVINTKLLLKDIIIEAVHEYAKEPYHNIIVNDLDDVGVELLEYRGTKPLYMIVDNELDIVTNLTLNGGQGGYFKAKTHEPVTLDSLGDGYDHRIQIDLGTTLIHDPTILQVQNQDGEYFGKYTVIKVEAGDVVGYRVTDLVYAGDLISNVGEPVTNMLDRIKSMLGDFEYFYNTDGQFIFQRKKTYLQTSFNNIKKDGDGILYGDNAANTTSFSYSFENANLISSFTNTPDYANLRNDFSIWGTRTSVSGNELPVHLRCAIDKKPTYYKNIKGQIFTTDKEIYDNFFNDAVDNIKEETKNELDSFTLNYSSGNLSRPQKQEDGSWTAGWWDIRDWHDYYKMLTGKEPKGTMKWYSSNDLNGCVPIQTLPGYENSNSNKYVWLIIVESDGDINTQHGSGNPNDRPYQPIRMYYESEYIYDENGNIVKDEEGYNKYRTYRVSEVPNKEFIYPYAGCTDTHTYLEFLEKDVNQKKGTVYFYNPNFPEANFEQIVQNKIDNMIKDYEESDMLNFVDWREIIYQMSLDYYQYGYYTNTEKKIADDRFLAAVRENNIEYYPSGYTGYEQYYTDLYSFWRQLYDPYYKGGYYVTFVTKSEYEENSSNYYYYHQCNSEILYDEEREYYIDTVSSGYKRKNNLTEEQYNSNPTNYYYIENCANKEYDIERIYYTLVNDEYDPETHWSYTVSEAPETLNFWFDFLDTEGELSKYSVQNIGSRPKAENNADVKAIYFREIPNVIFFDETTTDEELMEQREMKQGYTFIKLPEKMENLFSISSQGQSAKDMLDHMLYNYAYCTESISLSTIPVYYLEPNTRIFVRDDKSGINGEYLVERISLPLGHNGSMSISATKAVENMY